MVTRVRSANQDCAETNPCTFLLIERGLRSWTMNSHGGLSTRRSCAVRIATSIVAAPVASESLANAASNSSSFHCSKLNPFGAKFAEEKYRAMMPTSEDGELTLSAIALLRPGASGICRTAVSKTCHSTASNSTLTPQDCFRLSCMYSFIGSGSICPEPDVEIITLKESGFCAE